MSKVLIYLLAVLFFINTIYHLHLWRKCVYTAQITTGMKIVLVIIPIVFLSLAYSAGEGSIENILVAATVSASMISRVVGQGISKEGIYYWTNTGVNRLAKWEMIKKVDIDQSKNRIKKIRIDNYARYPNQQYQTSELKEIEKYIQRRM